MAAAGLLLLFTLQAGLGLYLHNALHQPPDNASRQQTHTSGVVVSIADDTLTCSCVDHFLVPFYAVEHPAVPPVFSRFLVQPQASDYYYLPLSLRIFRSLRAPPVFVS